jgi:Zn-dependent peptidase ImmA (M78 family)
MLSDYKVEYRREETIRNAAAACLAIHAKASSSAFDITEYVETSLREYCQKKRKCELRIFPLDCIKKYDEPANVTFRPNTIALHVDPAIWADAKAGGEHSRFVIAHEIGHIVFHDHTAKAFSEDPSLRIRFAEREYSAEWQADTFAEYFLVPDEAVKKFSDETLLSIMCNVTNVLARKRLNTYFSALGLIVDGPCGQCGNFSIIRQGIGMRCFACNRRLTRA